MHSTVVPNLLGLTITAHIPLACSTYPYSAKCRPLYTVCETSPSYVFICHLQLSIILALRLKFMETPEDRAISAVALSTLDLERSSLRDNSDPLTPSSLPAHARDREYVPPDGGYGWVCVASVFMINAHTWGLNFVSSHWSYLSIGSIRSLVVSTVSQSC